MLFNTYIPIAAIGLLILTIYCGKDVFLHKITKK